MITNNFNLIHFIATYILLLKSDSYEMDTYCDNQKNGFINNKNILVMHQNLYFVII